MEKPSLLSLKSVYKHFDASGGFLEQLAWKDRRPVRKRTIVHAVNNVSFEIRQGETLSVVGESGCGKSTLARTVIGLYPPNRGEILFKGDRIDNLSPGRMLPYRTRMQMVFQDPYASLNPRMRVREILEEPVRFHGHVPVSQAKNRVAEVMEQVGVDPSWADRYPHEFSGGQRQRISIARALVVDPEFIIADEPISALDVSIQAQILNLLMEAQETRGLTYMFISHDLSVVEHISTRVAVMYLGTVCELAPVEQLFEHPMHPYTRALLSAIPRLGEIGSRHIKLRGDVPTPIGIPTGCVFQSRCPWVEERCRRETPQLVEKTSGNLLACHAVEEGRLE
ncbi:MAG: ABC transporter ATP-binding protein [Desulfobacteraceae bacterium]